MDIVDPGRFTLINFSSSFLTASSLNTELLSIPLNLLFVALDTTGTISIGVLLLYTEKYWMLIISYISSLSAVKVLSGLSRERILSLSFYGSLHSCIDILSLFFAAS